MTDIMKRPFITGKSRSEVKQRKNKERQEKMYTASQWKLMAYKLMHHKLAIISMIALAILYMGAIFAPFLAPGSLDAFSKDYINAPPSKIHFIHQGHFEGPFIYEYNIERDKYGRKIFLEDTTKPRKISFFVKGSNYKLLGFIPSNIHLYGVDNKGLIPDQKPALVMIMGADSLGRDLFSRILLGSQVSLFVPFLGTIISFVLGIIIGGISGYFGGITDLIIQRIIEVMGSFPGLPLWMALSAAIPAGIDVTTVFILITVIMSLLSWPGLARTVRSKLMSLKNDDYILAAELIGVSKKSIISRHLIPGFMSPLIVGLTLGIPGMILGETSMSFLGLGMREPATSWGVLLQECQGITNIVNYPWKMIPILFVIITILTFNFLGDGLRDAADPYK